MFPIIVGLNHRTAPIKLREQASINHSEINQVLLELNSLPALNGVVLLNTCNRLEIYAAAPEIELGISAIKAFLARHSSLKEEDIDQYLYVHTLYACVRHLFRVAAGLDSMVKGETQILGQVAQAYEQSSRLNAGNKIMHAIFQNALAAGKTVRTKTQIDQHPTSVSYTAVELAKQTFGDIKGKSILVLGAGEVGALTARHLSASGATKVIVSNRSYQRARCLAEEFSGRAIPYENFASSLAEVDIVICATAAPDFVIWPEQIQKAMGFRDSRSLLLIDIAVPRNIHPAAGKIPGVTLFDIDGLQGVVDTHQKAREAAALQAEKIIAEEMDCFVKWHNSLFVVPTIIALRHRGEEVKEIMLRNALNKLGPIDAKQEKIIRSMANSIVTHLLNRPIANLKEAANTSQGHLFTEIMQSLFELEVSEEPSYSISWNCRG